MSKSLRPRGTLTRAPTYYPDQTGWHDETAQERADLQATDAGRGCRRQEEGGQFGEQQGVHA